MEKDVGCQTSYDRRRIQSTLTFDLRRFLTCRLKSWDNIAEILKDVFAMRLAKNAQVFE